MFVAKFTTMTNQNLNQQENQNKKIVNFQKNQLDEEMEMQRQIEEMEREMERMQMEEDNWDEAEFIDFSEEENQYSFSSNKELDEDYISAMEDTYEYGIWDAFDVDPDEFGGDEDALFAFFGRD